ncbi:MAG: MbnP family protein [Flavobacteriales bacterium]
MKHITIKNSIFLLLFSTILFSCKEEDLVIDKKMEAETEVSFVFKQKYNGSEVKSTDLSSTLYTNQKGNVHTISKLQYLVSKITLHKTDGSEVDLGGYNFVDMDKPLSRFYTPEVMVPEGKYTGVSMTFGFDEEDNRDGAYTDLNAASWSWPMMIGGGYHFLKFEGMFTDNTGTTKGFAFHNGTASKVVGSSRVHEANHFRVRLWDFNGGFEVKSGERMNIDIDMNIEEWFKNPVLWDLNQYYMMLMPNYTAQKLMNQNGKTVFSLGTIAPEL